jgi:hypothetical protein
MHVAADVRHPCQAVWQADYSNESARWPDMRAAYTELLSRRSSSSSILQPCGPRLGDVRLAMPLDECRTV